MKRQWQKAFLAALEESGSVTSSCTAANISTVRVYEVKRNDPEFAKQWEQALEQGADILEAEARRRAMEGTSKGSDTLLMFLLKGLRPQRWRESRATLPPAELDRMIAAELKRLAAAKSEDELTTRAVN